MAAESLKGLPTIKKDSFSQYVVGSRRVEPRSSAYISTKEQPSRITIVNERANVLNAFLMKERDARMEAKAARKKEHPVSSNSADSKSGEGPAEKLPRLDTASSNNRQTLTGK